MRRQVKAFARRAVGLITGLAVLAALAYGGLFALGYRPTAVYSGSMEPELQVGSLAFVESVPASSVRVGDVITFGDPYQPGRLVTHRVARIVEQPGGRAFRTKGDANLARDPWTIALPAQAGRVAFDVPFAGYLLWYSKTREVRLLLVGGIALSFLLSALRAIWRPQPLAEKQA